MPGGGVLIDTPGLREIGLWDDEGGVESAFPEIEALMARCRFGDCGHTNEPGCALREAIDDGSLDSARLDSYHKLQREVRHVQSRRDPKARHEHRQRMKRFTKGIRKRPDKRDRW